MDSTTYTKIFDGSIFMVARVISELEIIGISPIIKDESESGRLAGFGSAHQGYQEIYVNSNELEKALEVINRINGELIQ